VQDGALQTAFSDNQYLLERMEYVISKIDAAVDQLDWAIRLLLDHQAYVPGITLAGAAEEIIGSTLGDEAAFKILTQRASAQFGLSPAVVTQAHLNKAKNWLKHWQGLKDDETVALELEKEAIQYIVRACTNLIAHDRSLPSEGPRFFAWLSSNPASAHAL
jgi:hypothetical protein